MTEVETDEKPPTSFAGFDASQFPGMATMQWLKDHTNLVFCCVYLPAPSHHNGDWVTHLADIRKQGWGTVPIYVGQQLAGPGSHEVTAAQGSEDGADAARQMTLAAYPSMSFVYLDLEDGPPFAHPRTDYVAAWIRMVQAHGFGAGVYCSHGFAAEVAAAHPGTRIWAFKVPTTAKTAAAAPFPQPDVEGCGFAEAVIWQRQQNVVVNVPGASLLVDLDVATTADPSAP